MGVHAVHSAGADVPARAFRPRGLLPDAAYRVELAGATSERTGASLYIATQFCFEAEPIIAEQLANLARCTKAISRREPSSCASRQAIRFPSSEPVSATNDEAAPMRSALSSAWATLSV